MLATRYLSRSSLSRSFSLTQRFSSAAAAPAADNIYKVTTKISADGTHTAQLENGVKIVHIPKEDTCTTVGLFVTGGSAYETHETYGSSHFLRRFLYKGTNRTSGLRLTRAIENLSVDFQAGNERESIYYRAICNPGYSADVAEIMLDLLRPRLAEWEFLEVRELVRRDMNNRSKDLIKNIGDKVRHTAFRGVGLGRAPICPEYNFEAITPESLANYVGDNYNGNQITLVVVGNVPFEQELFLKSLVAAYAPLPAGTPSKPQPSKYYGGVYLEEGGPSNVYVEAYKGVERGSKDSAAQLVLASVLGDASGSFTLPGQIVNSRLAKEFGENIQQAGSFVCHDSQTLFGVRAIGTNPTSQLAELVHNQLKNLKNISKAEVDRAKTAIRNKFRVLMDSRSNYLTIRNIAGDNFAESIDRVSVDDVNRVAQQILSTPRTTVVIGDVTNLPSF